MSTGKVEHIGGHRKQCRSMYDLLREYARAGIALCLEGQESEPGRITATCLREGVSYMMDFIPEDSDSQKITKIDFVRIIPDDTKLAEDSYNTHPNISVLTS